MFTEKLNECQNSLPVLCKVLESVEAHLMLKPSRKPSSMVRQRFRLTVSLFSKKVLLLKCGVSYIISWLQVTVFPTDAM